MRLHRLMLLNLALWGTGTAMAGSAPGELSCRRAGTPFKLEGTVPAIEDALDLSFTDKEGTLHIDEEENGATIVKDLDAKVFVMVVSGPLGFKLYALPSTVRAKVHSNGEEVNFDAIVDEIPKSDAAKSKKLDSAHAYHHWLRMRCSYGYGV